MALVADFADPPSDLYPVDPLELDEIDFSCAVQDKQTDEFDYGDNLFQKPISECSVNETVGACVPKLDSISESNCEEQLATGCHSPGVKEIIKETKDISAGVKKATDLQKVTLDGLDDENNGQKLTFDNNFKAEVCQITVEFVDVQTNENDDKAASSALNAAQAEWDTVECVEASYADPSQGQKASAIVTTPVITFNEALQHFQNADLQHLKPEIRTSVNRTGFSALKYFLFGPPALNKDLVAEKDMAFCMAALSFDNSNEIHLRVLQTIYRILTGSKFDCPRYGSHYEEIGFQGNDPATDLRGGGFLGLMHILHLLTDQRTLPIAREIYKLSTDETQNFPFCLMGINISRITLQAAREGCLNKECNRRKQVVAVMNDFYVGTYLHLYEIWKNQHKTIGDSGFVIKEVEHFVKKNPKSVVKKLRTYLSKRKENSSVASGDQVVIDKLT